MQSNYYLEDYDKNYFHNHYKYKIFVQIVKPFFCQRQLNGSRLPKCLKSLGFKKDLKQL